MRFAPFVVVLLIACGVIAQTPQVNVSTQMVILNVRVKDAEGKAVLDIPQSSFVVSENGVPQKISLFMSEQVPLSYGLLIDASASLRAQLPDVVRTAVKIVDTNRPTDEAFVIRFISSEKIETVQAITSSKQALIAALDQMYIEGGSSAILDAVYLSAEYLAQNSNGNRRRRVLIVATDGEERASYYNAQQVVQILTATDIQVYIVAFTKDLTNDKHEKAVKLLSVLASNAGGRVYFPSSAPDPDRIANEIINDIRTQYLIGYIPSDGASKAFQKVEVSITDSQNQNKKAFITSVGYSTSAEVLKEQK